MGLDGKKDVHLDGSEVTRVSRLEVLERPSGRRVHSEAERAWIVADSLLPGAQLSEAARKHGTSAGGLRLTTTLSAERRIAGMRSFAVDIHAAVEEPLEERHVPAVKFKISIGNVVVRTDAAIDKEQLSRVIRAVRASR